MAASGPGERQPTKIEVVGEINQPIQYANYAKVQITPYEAFITFARIDPATAIAEDGGEVATVVDAPAIARTALPRKSLWGLYRAIETQWEDRGEPVIEEDQQWLLTVAMAPRGRLPRRRPPRAGG